MKVIFDDGKHRDESPEFPAPERPLMPGDVVVFKACMNTLGGEVYDVGDELLILERTDDRPHNRWNTEGNLRCRGKNGKATVWTNIEWVMHLGYMERKAA